MKLLDEEQPEMLIVSLVCGPIDALQRLNFNNVILEQIEATLRETIVHFTFDMILCKKRATRGRMLMFEHLANAKRWLIEMANENLQRFWIMTIDFDLCQFGVTSEYPNGRGFVKKKTRIMTNSI